MVFIDMKCSTAFVAFVGTAATTKFSATAFGIPVVTQRHHESRAFSHVLSATPAPPIMEILDDVTFSEDFPITSYDLIDKAKDVLLNKGIGTKDGGACLADNFEFVAAVVGPIPKAAYLEALGGFKIEDGFDLTNKFFGFSVDPTQPNRVWFFQRLEAVHTGTFMGAEPSGKEITYPPQVNHMDFDEEGKVTEFGFYTVDRRQGNTGGLGGAFGLMYAVGKPLPIPECQPYKPSRRFRFLQFIGRLSSKFQKK